jgi:DUF971 family protein
LRSFAVVETVRIGDETTAAWNSRSFDPSNKLRESAQRPAIIPAMQPSLGDPAAQSVSIGSGGRVLRVIFADGQSFDVGADRLRMQCRCAMCTRARIDGTFAPATQGIEIAQATPIGHYGLNIAFSDGHTRGIFPFAYIAELTAFEAADSGVLVDAADAAS